jgi:hypothetical protein
MSYARHQQSIFIYLTPPQTRVLHPGQRLIINPQDLIVTLDSPASGLFLAQCRFPTAAFRALILLLKSQRGASYAELLTVLYASEEVFTQLLQAPTADDAPMFRAEVPRWQEHLDETTIRIDKDPKALERELKPIRRAVKQEGGIQTISRQEGFGWRIRSLPQREGCGYILLRSPAYPPPNATPSSATGHASTRSMRETVPARR